MSEYEYHNAGNSEAQEKVALSRLFAQTGTLAATGVLGGLVVSQAATANGTVLIASGSCVVHPTMTAGASLLVNDTTKTLDIFTANPVGGLPRNDIIEFDSLTALISVRVGAPNATPTDPTVPATSVVLARLRHGASAVTIPTANIDNLIVATTLRGVSTTGQNMGTPATTSASGTPTVSTTETRDAVLGNYAFTVVAGRRYEVRVNGLQVSGSIAGDQYLAQIHYAAGATTPTSAHPLIASQRVYTPVNGAQIACPLAGTFAPSGGLNTLSVFLIRTAGTGVGACQALREMYVVDLGPA